MGLITGHPKMLIETSMDHLALFLEIIPLYMY